jgi:hypothetical protein
MRTSTRIALLAPVIGAALVTGAVPALASAAPSVVSSSPSAVHPDTDTCTNGFGNPNTCAQAVTWAKNHRSTSDNPNYVGRCDHVMALAYGWSSSGSTTARAHWLAIPAADKHAGDRSVPAGGLAFFSGGSSGAGHVMISIGGGTFISTDINGSGTLGNTTIATIENQWGETYSGWAEPWFQVNH